MEKMNSDILGSRITPKYTDLQMFIMTYGGELKRSPDKELITGVYIHNGDYGDVQS